MLQLAKKLSTLNHFHENCEIYKAKIVTKSRKFLAFGRQKMKNRRNFLKNVYLKSDFLLDCSKERVLKRFK